MEEQLDKLISLTESQNKAWERALRLLNEIYALMLEKYKAADLLLEQHPAVRAPGPRPVADGPVSSHRPTDFSSFTENQPYGYELEKEATPVARSFPVPADAISQEEVYQTQIPFKENIPEVPLTSKAEMMERVEKQDTSREGSA